MTQTLNDLRTSTDHGMLRSCFTFIPGVGLSTEQSLWRSGIFTWDDAVERLDDVRVGGLAKDTVLDCLERAEEALARNDIGYFANTLPRSEYWRLYQHFRARTLFLDIETTGLSQYYDNITLVGIFDGRANSFFLRDHNLGDIQNELNQSSIVVTFNGTNFDIPFLRKELPGIQMPPVHIDLRYLLRSIGIVGPMKQIEKRLGITRPDELSEMSGRDAAVLWRRFLAGDDAALKTLLLYNAFDTADLASLLDYCRSMKASQIAEKMQTVAFQMRLGEMPPPRTRVDQAQLRQLNLVPPRVSRVRTDIIRVSTGSQEILVNRLAITRPEMRIEAILHDLHAKQVPALSLGIDLSGSETRPTGVCVLRGQEAYLDTLMTDEELLDLMLETRPAVVSIDSPLSLPRGRCCSSDDCECRRLGITRECERTLKKRGINVYPCLIPSMQGLTNRGMRIAALARQHGLTVIESYPGAAQDILGLPRKRVDLAGLQTDLTNMGIEPKCDRSVISHHEIDAMTSALVGYLYLAGHCELLGNDEEGYLVIPSFQGAVGNALDCGTEPARRR